MLLALHRPPSRRHRDPSDGVPSAPRRRARRSTIARGGGAGLAARRRHGVAQRAQREPARRPAADAGQRQPDARGAVVHGERPCEAGRPAGLARGRQRAAAQGSPGGGTAARSAAVLQVLDRRAGRRPPRSRGIEQLAPCGEPPHRPRAVGHSHRGRDGGKLQSRRGCRARLADQRRAGATARGGEGGRPGRHAGDRRADPPRRPRGIDRPPGADAASATRRSPSSCCATSTRRPSGCGSRSRPSRTRS